MQRNDDKLSGGRIHYLPSVHALTCVRGRAPLISHGAPLPMALNVRTQLGCLLFWPPRSLSGLPSPSGQYRTPLTLDSLRAPPPLREDHKADVNVDTVHTPLAGQTAHTRLPLTPERSPTKKILSQNRRHHVVPATPDHEQVLATHDQADRTGTRNRKNAAPAGGRPISQGLEPATPHT